MSSVAAGPGWGFPKAEGQSASYWQRQVQDDDLLDHGANEELPQSADIIVIGSGITGSLIAKALKETQPCKSLLVLEARGFCSGATGRNAGHCKSSSFKLFPKYEREFGAEEATKILQNEENAQSALVRYVRKHKVDCDLWVGDSFDVPMTPEVATEIKRSFFQYRDAGGDVEHIKVTSDPATARRITGLRTAEACYARPAATLHPWKLSAHLMRECLAMGVILRTFTVVQNVMRSTDSRSRWTVCTNRGSICCNQVVHATNAYTGAHEPFFRNIIRPNPHICNQIRPPTWFIRNHPPRNSCTALLPDGATVSINSRYDLDGTILLGGDNPGQRTFDRWVERHPEHAIDDSFTEIKEVTEGLRGFATAEFDGWNDTDSKSGALVHCWSGILGMTSDRMPLVGEIPGKEGQWVCVALNGYGMTKVFAVAPGLVRLMNGTLWEETGLPKAYGLTMDRIKRLGGDGTANAAANPGSSDDGSIAAALA